MQLTYRGVNYQSNPSTIELTEGTISGKYRGVATKLGTIAGASQSGSESKLTYRGVSYSRFH